MREIKFRTWDIKNQEYTQNTKFGNYEYSESLNGVFEDENFVFEQFTGLTDENETDIYEGDLFEVFEVFSNSSPVVGKVIYSDGCFMIEYDEINKPTSMMLYWFLRNTNEGIIGNIHQNPKLLK